MRGMCSSATTMTLRAQRQAMRSSLRRSIRSTANSGLSRGSFRSSWSGFEHRRIVLVHIEHDGNAEQAAGQGRGERVGQVVHVQGVDAMSPTGGDDVEENVVALQGEVNEVGDGLALLKRQRHADDVHAFDRFLALLVEAAAGHEEDAVSVADQVGAPRARRGRRAGRS